MSKSATIVVPLFDGVEIMDIAGPSSVFAVANREIDPPPYNLLYGCDLPGGAAVASCGLTLQGIKSSDLPKHIDLLLVPGADEPHLGAARQNPAVSGLISNAVDQAATHASVCSGAFFLGDIGLLDARRATTHWEALVELQKEFPQSQIETDALFVRDGNLWTSAGVTSGIDMALAMVKDDLGPELALTVARRLVVFLVRTGKQSQFTQPINLQRESRDDAMNDLIAWIQSNLAATLTVTRLAERLAVSERSLHRKCLHAFGLTPSRLVSRMRLDRARALLLDAKLTLKQIAFECGFSSAPALTKTFVQHFGVSPSQYRERFR